MVGELPKKWVASCLRSKRIDNDQVASWWKLDLICLTRVVPCVLLHHARPGRLALRLLLADLLPAMTFQPADHTTEPPFKRIDSPHAALALLSTVKQPAQQTLAPSCRIDAAEPNVPALFKLTS